MTSNNYNLGICPLCAEKGETSLIERKFYNYSKGIYTCSNRGCHYHPMKDGKILEFNIMDEIPPEPIIPESIFGRGTEDVEEPTAAEIESVLHRFSSSVHELYLTNKMARLGMVKKIPNKERNDDILNQILFSTTQESRKARKDNTGSDVSEIKHTEQSNFSHVQGAESIHVQVVEKTGEICNDEIIGQINNIPATPQTTSNSGNGEEKNAKPNLISVDIDGILQSSSVNVQEFDWLDAITIKNGTTEQFVGEIYDDKVMEQVDDILLDCEQFLTQFHNNVSTFNHDNGVRCSCYADDNTTNKSNTVEFNVIDLTDIIDT